MIGPGLAKAIFFLLGFTAFSTGLWAAFRNLLAKSWPVTKGEIVSSVIETDVDNDEYLVVEYEFYADGRLLRGKNVTLGGWRSGNPKERIKRYYVGAKVGVHYNPSNPEDCCLEPSVHPGLFFVMVAGTIFMVIALVADFSPTQE